MGRIKINDIDKSLLYEGYLWMSDSEKPIVFDSACITMPEEGSNPFVIEGQLYQREKGLSYSIKYVDGQYLIQEFIVKKEDLEDPDNQIKIYESNRMGNKKLQFLRYWEEVFDLDNYKDSENPNGLPVLTLTKNVFIGFI